MPWVTLRHFAWTEKTLPSGQVEVEDFFPIRADSTLPVDVAELIYVNALAPAGPNHVKYATRAHELALITTYLTSRSNDALALRTSDFKSSSLHIKRFVSESLGLGMLTATVESLYHWDRRQKLFNFDALPLSLAQAFKKRGPRPDLLFDFPQSRLAGEARGRSHPAPVTPNTPQCERLTSLLAWSRLHGDHDVVMTWAYLTSKGVTVDIYIRADNIFWFPQAFGKPLSPEAAHSARQLRAGFDVPMLDPSPRRPAITPSPPDPASPNQLVLAARQHLDRVAMDLYETAPVSDVHVEGQELRGSWVPSDVLDESRGAFLLGVLPEGLPPDRSAQLTARLRERGASLHEQQDGDRFTATVRDRLVVAYAPGYSGDPWHLVEDLH